MMITTTRVKELNIIVALVIILIDDTRHLESMSKSGNLIANADIHYSSPPNILSQQVGQMPEISISRSLAER